MSEERTASRPGPIELRDPLIRQELKRASVWFGLVLLVVAVIFLAQPLLLIFAGIVFAAMLDGGTRLLGRVLPIGRGWRLAIVTLAALGFVVWTIWFAGIELAAPGGAAARRSSRSRSTGSSPGRTSIGLVEGGIGVEQLSGQLMGSLGRLTSAVVERARRGHQPGDDPRHRHLHRGRAAGSTSAASPGCCRCEQRDRFYRTAERMGFTLRRLMAGRLLGMAVEGVGTWLLLLIGGVPMAALLGLLTGLLAFLPNIGAIISGVLIVLVGFSVSVDAGPVGDRRLFHRPDRRRLSDRPLRRQEDGRPRAGSGARRAAPVRRPVRDHGPRARRSDRGDDQDRRSSRSRRTTRPTARRPRAPESRGRRRPRRLAAVAPGRRRLAGRPGARLRPLRPAAAPAEPRPAAAALGGRRACIICWSCCICCICCAAAMPGAIWSTSMSNTSVSLRPERRARRHAAVIAEPRRDPEPVAAALAHQLQRPRRSPGMMPLIAGHQRLAAGAELSKTVPSAAGRHNGAAPGPPA